EPGDAVVVGGGVVEDLREEAPALGLVLVVLPEDGVWRHLARIAIHCNGGREPGALRGWPAAGARGVIATGAASPARSVGGPPQVPGASSQRGPRARRAPWVARRRCPGRHRNGGREPGALRGWPAAGARG